MFVYICLSRIGLENIEVRRLYLFYVKIKEPPLRRSKNSLKIACFLLVSPNSVNIENKTFVDSKYLMTPKTNVVKFYCQMYID